MWYGRDIKNKIITRLIDTTYGISALITTINTERSESTELPLQVNAEKDEGQYPLVFVDLGDSDVLNTISSDENTMIENISLEVTAFLMGNNVAKLKNDCENYIEAILRCLQGWKEESNQGSYICQANSIMRADIDTEQDNTKRAVTVTFTVYSNQI